MRNCLQFHSKPLHSILEKTLQNVFFKKGKEKENLACISEERTLRFSGQEIHTHYHKHRPWRLIGGPHFGDSWASSALTPEMMHIVQLANVREKTSHRFVIFLSRLQSAGPRWRKAVGKEETKKGKMGQLIPAISYNCCLLILLISVI